MIMVMNLNRYFRFPDACAKGSRDRQNNKGESGHPCLVPRCKGNEGEIILPVMTDAAGEWYNVLIIETKCSPKPKHCRCYGANKTWRHVDPFARLYFETWSKHRQGRTVANRYNTDKAESSPKASVGRRSANNIQQGQGRER